MSKNNIDFETYLNKEITISYCEEKQVQGVLTKISPNLGVTINFSKIKDNDIIHYTSYNNNLFLPFCFINNLEVGLCMIDEEECLENDL